jgi:aspartate/methionine/tyrosine aminotransferase
MRPFANRLRRLGTETAFEVFARAKALESQGLKIIHLETGEPNFDTPGYIREAAKRALDEGQTRYTFAAGLMPLRRAIAEEVAGTRGIPVSPENVVIVPGGKPMVFFTIQALVNPGDEVVYPNPGFRVYESLINFVGGTPVPLPLREEREFSFDPDEFKSLVGPRTKLIILNSPGNPCGGVLSESDLKTVASAAQEHDCYVLSDEIYSRILYDGQHRTIAALPGMQERTVIVDGFSETYAMTGWRLGYGVMRDDLAGWITRLMVNSNSCAAAFTQMAGLAALKGDPGEVRRMVADLRRNRDVMVLGLNDIPGVRCCNPHGAYYVFPNVRGLGLSSRELADRLMHEAGVATLPGTAFGTYGEGYLRISYATSAENIPRAVRRIREFAS